MWDVKRKVEIVCAPFSEFSINYVGCKAISIKSKLAGNCEKFSINYVGCKVLSFILLTARLNLFSINYVGCKEFSERDYCAYHSNVFY